MAWVTQAPRTPDIGPSVTFAIKAAQNKATKKIKTSNSRQLQVIRYLPLASHQSKEA
jgi:hypothetical protein